MKSLYIYIFCLILLGTNAYAQELELGPEQCGPISSPGQYGPFDYNNAADREERLPVVEQYHFSKNIQALKPDVNGSLPGPHLDYVLRAFPNHHPALNLLTLLAIREKSPKPSGASYPMECYFERAVRFKGDDPLVYLIHANYLAKNGRYKEALERYKQAEAINPENTDLLYNMGLLYFNMKDYDKSRNYAKRAYAKGFPLPGLKNKLQKAGKWD